MKTRLVIASDVYTTPEEILDLIAYHIHDDLSNEPVDNFLAILTNGQMVGITFIEENTEDEDVDAEGFWEVVLCRGGGSLI